jgi:putative transposase
MRHPQYTLSCKDVSRWAVQWMTQALGWTTLVGSVSSELLVQLLVRAAAEMRSLSAIVREASAAPSVETIRLALGRCLPGTPAALLPATTKALHTRLPKSLKRRPRTMAIDWHLRPYYGDRRTPGIFRGQPKAGTKSFFAYATLLVIRRGQTFTVGLTHVVNGEEQTAVMARLLEQARQAGLRVRRLLLDRGFYAATTIHWLQQASIAFVMPMIRRGQSGRRKADCTGTAQFFVARRRGWTTHTWTARPRRGGRKRQALTVTVDVCMAPRPLGRGKKKGPLVFACHGVRCAPRELVARYRKRFRIETSYRQLGQGLAATCSTNPVFRLLLVAIALVLRNLWVWLHGVILAERRESGRRVCHDKLPLRKMTYWILRVLDKTLGVQPGVVTT